MPRESEFRAVIAEAEKAGRAAADARTPTPMVVSEHADVMNDSSPVVRRWNVPSGVCGFAWVKLRPANSAFANFAKKNAGFKKDSYAGGLLRWVSEYGQSMERKEAFASAYAGVLEAHGYKAYADSRMD